MHMKYRYGRLDGDCRYGKVILEGKEREGKAGEQAFYHVKITTHLCNPNLPVPCSPCGKVQIVTSSSSAKGFALKTVLGVITHNFLVMSVKSWAWENMVCAFLNRCNYFFLFGRGTFNCLKRLIRLDCGVMNFQAQLWTSSKTVSQSQVNLRDTAFVSCLQQKTFCLSSSHDPCGRLKC